MLIFKIVPAIGYPLKAGQSTKSGNCADFHKLLVAGLLPNS
ncbi:hypothetical protein VT99_10851, partial [Candidatus Electrothrix marina]